MVRFGELFPNACSERTERSALYWMRSLLTSPRMGTTAATEFSHSRPITKSGIRTINITRRQARWIVLTTPYSRLYLQQRSRVLSRRKSAYKMPQSRNIVKLFFLDKFSHIWGWHEV